MTGESQIKVRKKFAIVCMWPIVSARLVKGRCGRPQVADAQDLSEGFETAPSPFLNVFCM